MTSDVDAMLLKLQDVISSIQEAYRVFNDCNDSSFYRIIDMCNEKFYGEWMSVLLELLDTIEKEAEKDEKLRNSRMKVLIDIMNNCLGVAEDLLRDEKYRPAISDTPALFEKVIGLLESLDGAEAKK
ncbi:hypothetical protein ROZALSC1DRAFT_23649, partial [Rozella allomycis CSF55]